MKLSDAEVITKHDELEMMRRPHLWPAAVLHLKLWDAATHSYRNFALLSYKDEQWTFTPKTKLDAFSEPDFSKSETGDETLLRRLVKRGWLVD
jgi:hypothetical protein